MKNCSSFLENLKNSKSTSTTLRLLGRLNEIISSSQDELDFFCNSGGLRLILKLFTTDNELVYTCLKILLNASKRNEKFRKELVKSNIFHLLSIQLKKELNSPRKILILYAALIIMLVHGRDDAQNQMKMTGCLSYLVYILNTFLADAERNPLPSKNIQLLVYSIIVSNKDPRHLENQTEVGWITPKIVEYLGKQTIFCSGDQIQVLECFWSFLKSILHKNELNQRIFLKCSGFAVLFRSMQEIVDEDKSQEFGDLLIKMTGVLIRLKSQKEFLQLASNYCSVMILRSLLNTCNAWVIQHVMIFLHSLTQEIPHALQPIKDKGILQCLIRAKIILSESKMTAELCQSIWERTITCPEIPRYYNSFTPDRNFTSSSNKSYTLSEFSYLKNQFCIIHDNNALKMSQFHSDYFFDSYGLTQTSEHSKMNETNQSNIWEANLKNQLKERKALKFGQINPHVRRKSFHMLRITFRRIIHFLGHFVLFLRRSGMQNSSICAVNKSRKASPLRH